MDFQVFENNKSSPKAVDRKNEQWNQKPEGMETSWFFEKHKINKLLSCLTKRKKRPKLIAEIKFQEIQMECK